eukprot:TRINITY_DN1009_c0_g1_i1.p1 TRINITY_DN1009_c0_g1~~TRINITY_DN1009_c0_g1_i1.p1  ORF type:complete len:166 (-),score=47.08 TRINITY_DN1009_c0_g1_i1:168-665(-)
MRILYGGGQGETSSPYSICLGALFLIRFCFCKFCGIAAFACRCCWALTGSRQAGGAGGGRGEAMLFDPTCEAGEEMLSALAEAEEVKAELLELSSSVKGWLQQGEEEMAMAVVAANRAALEEQLAGEEEPGVQQAAMLVTLSRFYLLPPPLQNQQEHSNMFSMVC